MHATLDKVDWPAIRARIFGRLDPLHDSAVAYRRTNGIDVYTEPARFVAPRVLEVGGQQITATQIVVATGARPMVPPIPGLDDVAYHTSDTIMRIDAIPASMIVIGGGFIAAELGHVFGAFGSDGDHRRRVGRACWRPRTSRSRPGSPSSPSAASPSCSTPTSPP